MIDETTTLYLALVHHPVINKNREVIGSAVTNLDIHDIARAGRTYGVARYFIVSPYKDQHTLVAELLDHWLKGHGARYNPARKSALERVRLEWSVEGVVESLTAELGQKPLIIATSAASQGKTIGFSALREKLGKNEPVLLLFGTAHGLAPEIMQESDYSLPPILGGTSYNHLSVRSAAAIIIDRLLGS